MEEITRTRAGLMRLRQNVVLLPNTDDSESFYPVSLRRAKCSADLAGSPFCHWVKMTPVHLLESLVSLHTFDCSQSYDQHRPASGLENQPQWAVAFPLVTHNYQTSMSRTCVKYKVRLAEVFGLAKQKLLSTIFFRACF